MRGKGKEITNQVEQKIRILCYKSGTNNRPLAKFFVAVWSSTKLKFFHELLKVPTASTFSLALLLFPLDILDMTGLKDGIRINDFFLSRLRNERQWACALDVLDSVPIAREGCFSTQISTISVEVCSSLLTFISNNLEATRENLMHKGRESWNTHAGNAFYMGSQEM